MKVLWPALLGMFVCPVGASEPIESRGLLLAWDNIPEQILVDGMRVSVRRATGAGVAEAVIRTEAAWRAQSPLVQRLRSGGWELLSRWQGEHSEVLQWRGAGDEAELLFSRLSARHPAQRMSPAPMSLPSRCAWGRQIEGEVARQRYLQRSARCRGTAQHTLPALRQSLQSSGWVVNADTGSQLHAQRSGDDAMVTVVPGRDSEESWLIWISGASR